MYDNGIEFKFINEGKSMNDNTITIDFTTTNQNTQELIQGDIKSTFTDYPDATTSIKPSFYKSDGFQNFIATLVLLPIGFVFIKGLQAMSIL